MSIVAQRWTGVASARLDESVNGYGGSPVELGRVNSPALFFCNNNNKGVTVLETIGDLILCVSIIGGAVVFTCANINYLPDKNNDEGDNK